jgi:dienelactone hydrolase
MESYDLQGLIGYLYSRPDLCPTGRIGLWGESMGGATTLWAASRETSGVYSRV